MPIELPMFVPFQEPKRGRVTPSGAEWIHEPKLDGYRVMIRIEEGDVRWFGRDRLDLTGAFPQMDAVLAPLTPCILDCHLRAPDGPEAQARFHDVLARRGGGPAEGILFAIDLLFWAGEDLRGLALTERKSWLEALVRPAGVPRSSHFFLVEPLQTDSLGAVVAPDLDDAKLEIVSKQRHSRYRSGQRPATWITSKLSPK